MATKKADADKGYKQNKAEGRYTSNDRSRARASGVAIVGSKDTHATAKEAGRGAAEAESWGRSKKPGVAVTGKASKAAKKGLKAGAREGMVAYGKGFPPVKKKAEKKP